MAITKQQFSGFIKQFNFRELFNEMGWNNDKTLQPISVDNITFSLQAVAEKSGFKILICPPADRAGNPPGVGLIPDSNLRKKIETKVTRLFQEHLIIYTDAHKQEQIWQLVVRQAGKPTKVTETRWHIAQDPQLLFQRASGIIFEMAEEDTITIVDVTKRMSDNFHQNAEKVTKKFYEGFKKEHTAFLQFIEGIEEKANKEWYVSLMLNRLMFCYFIQKKNFLDRNKNYLRDKLLGCQQKRGENKFYSFYRDFLLLLFHSGLNGVLQSAEVKAEIGLIPYLNGGLFDEHELEKRYQHIAIDDKAFERLFDFFDQYEWHLDTRINTSGKDINPDVIGYIFEKYINDRAQMGAYYTKEDITEYIGKNCIIPFLFDETKRRFPKAFAPDGAIWQMVRQSGDRYIYDAGKKGMSEHDFNDLQDGQDYERLWNDLPEEIQIGINPNQADLVEKRKAWNKPAPPDIALPTEIYREVIDRRKRYYDIKTKIEGGEITNINDFITYNLNIRQFTIDVIENTNDPEFLRHFYIALISMTLLDPTCGSGAFLFAALNILEELYEACLLRMRNFVEDEDRLNHSEKSNFHNKYKYFRDTLAETQNEQHPNQQYFIYKTIILRNLYGVDIMNEAVEIAKLRLFLKLVATVEADYQKPNLGLEPLPDIDFNIRAGNTLVGFAKLDDAIRAVNEKDKKGQMGLVFDNELDIINSIKNQADDLARVYKSFKNAQLDDNLADFKKAKDKLMNYMAILNTILNEYLAFSYGIDAKKKKENYKHWFETHQPFHWFAEFYEIVHDKGGFDVVIGNPPYLEFNQINYNLFNFKTLDTCAVHAFCMERSVQILNKYGNLGMIVPLSLVSTQRMKTVQNLIETNKATVYNNFSWRPAKLFDTVNRALTIFIANHSSKQKVFTNNYLKWTSDTRHDLTERINLIEIDSQREEFWVPKISNSIENSVLKKMKAKEKLGFFCGKTNNRVYYRTDGGLYWKIFTDFAPKFISGGVQGHSTRETWLSLIEKHHINNAIAALSSNTFWWWYTVTSNCRHLNPYDVMNFPIDIDILNDTNLFSLGSKYISDVENNSNMLIRIQKQTGETQTQSFKISKSKSIIDEIDTVLAEHYGFTDEELDFIINYDIKYRMGKELEEDV